MAMSASAASSEPAPRQCRGRPAEESRCEEQNGKRPFGGPRARRDEQGNGCREGEDRNEPRRAVPARRVRPPQTQGQRREAGERVAGENHHVADVDERGVAENDGERRGERGGGTDGRRGRPAWGEAAERAGKVAVLGHRGEVPRRNERYAGAEA